MYFFLKNIQINNKNPFNLKLVIYRSYHKQINTAYLINRSTRFNRLSILNSNLDLTLLTNPTCLVLIRAFQLCVVFLLNRHVVLSIAVPRSRGRVNKFSLVVKWLGCEMAKFGLRDFNQLTSLIDLLFKLCQPFYYISYIQSGFEALNVFILTRLICILVINLHMNRLLHYPNFRNGLSS